MNNRYTSTPCEELGFDAAGRLIATEIPRPGLFLEIPDLGYFLMEHGAELAELLLKTVPRYVLEGRFWYLCRRYTQRQYLYRAIIAAMGPLKLVS